MSRLVFPTTQDRGRGRVARLVMILLIVTFLSGLGLNLGVPLARADETRSLADRQGAAGTALESSGQAQLAGMSETADEGENSAGVAESSGGKEENPAGAGNRTDAGVMSGPGAPRKSFDLDLSEAEPSGETDSAGTMFTFEGFYDGIGVGGDLYWMGNEFSLIHSLIGNDLILLGRSVVLSHDGVDGDLRALARSISTEEVEVHGVITAAAFDMSYGRDTKATGIYSFADRVYFGGSTSRLVLYGQDVYLNGVVEGDATVSAQRLTIGPEARIEGTLYIQSGQYPDVPDTATINVIDNTQGNANAVDQVIELRSKIAPLFQVGGVLFTVVSFVIMALLGFWIIGQHYKNANRTLRRHPLLLIISGLLSVILLPLFCVLLFALIFTIPVAVVLLLLLAAAALIAVPFTGASLGLLLPDHWSGALRVMIGALAGGALCFVPYINVAAFVWSLIYLFGYVVYSLVARHEPSGEEGCPVHQRAALVQSSQVTLKEKEL